MSLNFSNSRHTKATLLLLSALTGSPDAYAPVPDYHNRNSVFNGSKLPSTSSWYHQTNGVFDVSLPLLPPTLRSSFTLTERAPLFRSPYVCWDISIEAPFQSLYAGTVTNYPTTLNLYMAGATNKYEVELNTRGRARLKMCDVKPLKFLVLGSGEKESGEDFVQCESYSLVTHCKNATGGRYDDEYQNAKVLNELLIYQMVSCVEPEFLRTQLARVVYWDIETQSQSIGYGIIRESKKGAATRLGLKEVPPTPELIDFRRWFRHGLFQLMIQNVDNSFLRYPGNPAPFSNLLFLRRPHGEIIPVPYDFDESAFVKGISVTIESIRLTEFSINYYVESAIALKGVTKDSKSSNPYYAVAYSEAQEYLKLRSRFFAVLEASPVAPENKKFIAGQLEFFFNTLERMLQHTTPGSRFRL